LGQSVEQAWNIGGIVLTIGVHRDDHVARAVLEAGHQGGRLAIVAAKVDNLNARVATRQVVE
jgi:hypothetical protein